MRFTDKVRKYNYFQIFNEDIVVSDIMVNTAQYGIKDEYAFQLDQKTLRVCKLLENAVIFGGAQAPSSTAPMTMQGIIGPGSSSTNIDIQTNVTNASGAALSESLINTMLETIYEQGGKPDTMMMGPYQKMKLDALMMPYQRASMSDNVLGQIVDTFRSAFGNVTVLLNYYMKDANKGKDIIIFFQKDLWKIGHYQNLAFAHYKLPKTATTEAGYVNGVYSTILYNEEWNGYLYGLATS